MSPAKLSKIEHGHVLPTITDVDLVLTALGISEEAKAGFLDEARAAVTEATAWRELRRMGAWKRQQQIRAIEASTHVLRLFQGQLVPGLLQCPEYVAGIYELPPQMPAETRSRTIAARLERQRVLHDPSRTFHFVITEGALRWRVCSRSVMAVQMDRLLSLSRLLNIRIGVLPANARMPDFPMTCFSMHDARLVLVETFHAEVTTRDPKDIEVYEKTFDAFADVALYDEEMRDLVATLRDGFLTEQERP
jgi:transcriptional regulator with XRE-family HTH domain